MRQWLICGGMDGSHKALELLEQAVQQRRPAGILFLGGILKPDEQRARGTGKKDLTPQEAEWYAEFFETMARIDVFTALVPAGHDVPVREFLRIGMGAEVQNPKLHLVHGALATNRDVAICGIGGELTEWVDTGEHSVRVSRSVAEYLLRPLWAVEKPRKVLLLGAPPPGPMGGAGDGAAIAGELIDSYHPDLCAVGGRTEHRGVQQIAGTTVVNPGRLADGSAAWLDWLRPRPEQVELLDLRETPVAG